MSDVNIKIAAGKNRNVMVANDICAETFIIEVVDL